MHIYYSELCLINNDLFENIRRLKEAGSDYVELMMDGEPWNRFHEHMESLSKRLNSLEMHYAVHSPVWDINLTAENFHVRKAALETYKEAIRFAKLIHAEHLVIHPGFSDIPVFNKETAKKRAREALLELVRFNKDFDVLLLIENVGNESTSIFTMEEYLEFLDDFPVNVKYILDIGHANITGWDIPDVIKILGSRLRAMHVNDNDGKRDIHLAIGEGTVDWTRVYEAIKETDKCYDLILEYNYGTELKKLTEGKLILEKALGL